MLNKMSVTVFKEFPGGSATVTMTGDFRLQDDANGLIDDARIALNKVIHDERNANEYRPPVSRAKEPRKSSLPRYAGKGALDLYQDTHDGGKND